MLVLIALLLTSPVWLKLLRAVWLELNESLEDEGGLFGGWRRGERAPRVKHGLVHVPRFAHRPEGHPGRPRGLAAQPRSRKLAR